MNASSLFESGTGESETRAAQLIGLHPKSIYRLRRLGL